MKRPLILISNDDGYQAKGINDLIEMVRTLADVLVCAPDGPRSGQACAFSATTPLTLTQRRKEDGVEVWSCNGTPVDCVKMALANLCPRKPDMVIGGINHGDNASVNTHYSGTMGAVLEGCMKDIPSIGISLYLQRGQRYEDHPVSEDTLAAAAALCRRVLEQGLPQDVCLNINLPIAHKFRGWQVCRQARGRWSAEWTDAHNPRGQRCFWLTGEFTDLEPEATDTDFAALRAGYCSIVPVTVDTTAYHATQHINTLL